MIGFELMMYLKNKQNPLNLAAKVLFVQMSTPQEKALYVSWCIERNWTSEPSETLDANKEGKHLQSVPFICGIKARGVLQRKEAGRSQISEEEIQSIRVACARSAKTSILRAFTPLQIPRSTLHDVLQKSLQL